MIKTIIKRADFEEPFMAGKLTRWAEYAAEKLPVPLDWPTMLLNVVNKSAPVITSRNLQLSLIDEILEGETWSHYLMAGRLYAPLLWKDTYGDAIPTIKEHHEHMHSIGYMAKLKYSAADYAHMEQFIDHQIDTTYPHFRLDYIYKKYSLQDRVKKKIYETPQHVYMRVAMALAEDRPKAKRLHDAERWYHYLKRGALNAPTPNFINLGTYLNGLASCCIYTCNDSAVSIGIGLHIAYTMTYMSAGCGTHLNTRSLGDAVRNGMISHQGKLPYLRATRGMVEANLQNGRGGADTATWSAYDPEGETLVALQNPMSVESKKIRGIDYSMTTNKWFARFAARKEKLFRFNCHTAPDLYEAMYSGDEDLFAELYTKYEQDPMFVKDYFNAREQILQALNEADETGRYYLTWADEMNRHTPFYDPIYASNLCQEIMLAQRAYDSMPDLYATTDVGFIRIEVMNKDLPYQFAASDKVYVNRGKRKVIPAIDLKVDEAFSIVEGASQLICTKIIEKKYEPEVAMCNIGGIVPSMIDTDEEYAEVAYYALLMVDVCIHKTHYELPHIGFTTKNRMNAGIGIVGLAHWMAKNKFLYSTMEGRNAIHRIHETHAYHLITQSIRLGKELGNAPWMHRTKWPEGYTPLDSYQRAVDELHTQPNLRDWVAVSNDLIENKGMRFSVTTSHMPAESSSKAAGQPNGEYPVRDLVLTKTDNGIKSYWAAPESDTIGEWYEIAWDISLPNQVAYNAIGQKWTDQGMSIDQYRRIKEGETISSTESLNTYFMQTKYGYKSRYYTNALTSTKKELEDGTFIIVNHLNTDGEAAADCGSGGCKM